jgi:hypothetical protein
VIEKHKWLFIWAIVLGTSFGVYNHTDIKIQEQQRQIDEVCSVRLAWVQTQNVISDGICVIKSGTEYNVFFIWYNHETAVLISKGSNGEIEYTICRGVNPDILKEWHTKRQFRG